MLRFNLFILILTFSQLILDLNALMCKKGERISPHTSRCEPCPAEYYQPTENDSKSCLGCVVCMEDSGSSTVKECTLLTNAVCKCRDGFVSMTDDSALCRCVPGFGLQNGVCSKCTDGSFSTKANSPCKGWTHCSAGVKQAGSATSDVICNESKMNPLTAKPSTPQILAVITTRRPHEGDHALRTGSTTTTTTTSSQDNVPTTSQSNTRNYAGVVILLLGIAGLLVWTMITCKMHITLCKQKTMQTKDSLCRRPVEESGDSNDSIAKLNPEP